MSARDDYPQLVGVDDALCNALDEIDRLRAEVERMHVDAAPLWEVMEQSDMTEGRGSMRHRSFHATEQGAWDSINDRGGVMGSHPRNFMGARQRAENWQQYAAQGGFGDYEVRPIPRLNPRYDDALAAVRRQQEAPAPDTCTCGHSRSEHPCAARGSECPCRLFWPRLEA